MKRSTTLKTNYQIILVKVHTVDQAKGFAESEEENSKMTRLKKIGIITLILIVIFSSCSSVKTSSHQCEMRHEYRRK